METKDGRINMATQFVRENFFLIAVIILVLSFTVVFYSFWTGDYILEQCGDGEMYRYEKYLHTRTSDWGSLIPTRTVDFFPGANMETTFNLIVPFYYLFPSYDYMILVQTLAFGSSILIFYLLAKEYLSEIFQERNFRANLLRRDGFLQQK